MSPGGILALASRMTPEQRARWIKFGYAVLSEERDADEGTDRDRDRAFEEEQLAAAGDPLNAARAARHLR